ncbi:MAG: response regulator transcription factor [Anaerolineales bacterium]|nr:response regulator transcription factor [Anaerolineales bacterium]
MTNQRILVVDDEPQVLEVLKLYLTRDGFRVHTAADGEAALSAFESHAPDLVVLDLMLPKLDGLSVFKRLRAKRAVPIIMLTARGDEVDRVLGLELGADDYVVKPFSPREVVARVKNVLRHRAPPADDSEERAVAYGDVRIDPSTRAVQVAERQVELTSKEFDLLHFLARHPGQVFTRAQLLDKVWGYEFFGDASTVTVHIRRLREKIETNPAEPRYLATVWGVGYKFEKEA